jgi:hypothetical protein
VLALAAEAPKITDWMQGWGNVLGVLMSSIAVIFTGLLFRHERNVRREEQADSEAAQARLVVGSVGRLSRDRKSDVVEPGSGPFTGIGWQVNNLSGLPVLDVSIRIFGGWLPSGLIDHVADIMRVDTVEGGIKLQTPIAIGERDAQCDTRVEIKFTDSNGLVWTRVDREQPVRVFGGSASRHPAVSLASAAIVAGLIGVGLAITALWVG